VVVRSEASLLPSAPSSVQDAVAFSAGGDGGTRSPEHLAMAGRNLWLLGIWVEQPLKKILPYHRCDEFTDEPTHAHIPKLCL